MEQKRIGIVGTGFIGRGQSIAIDMHPDYQLSYILTRRKITACQDHPFAGRLTNSVQALMEHSDLVIECSGDVLYATEVVNKLMDAGIPVVTMNVEMQLVAGSYLATKGLITEAEGDQPGSLAALHENVVKMGFKPLVYGNVKGFLDENPSRKSMMYWSRKQGLSLDMVTSFTDGTKVQMEQAILANGLGADLVRPGMLGLETEQIEDVTNRLALSAKYRGKPISEYIVSRHAPPGVFIIAEHHQEQREYLRHCKMGDGPYYAIVTPYHLCHLEVIKTINRVFRGQGVLLGNGAAPVVSVAAIAKTDMSAGEWIDKAVGSFEFRGRAIRIEDDPDHVPISLLTQAVLKRRLRAGDVVRYDDVELPDSLALKFWHKTMAHRVRIYQHFAFLMGAVDLFLKGA